MGGLDNGEIQYQLWIQIGLFLFAAGVLYQQVRQIRESGDATTTAVRALTEVVNRDHDQLLRMEGWIKGSATATEQKLLDLERRLTTVERKCEYRHEKETEA